MCSLGQCPFHYDECSMPWRGCVCNELLTACVQGRAPWCAPLPSAAPHFSPPWLRKRPLPCPSFDPVGRRLAFFLSCESARPVTILTVRQRPPAPPKEMQLIKKSYGRASDGETDAYKSHKRVNPAASRPPQPSRRSATCPSKRPCSCGRPRASSCAEAGTRTVRA